MKKRRFFLTPAIFLIPALLVTAVPFADARKAPQGLYVGDPDAGDKTGAKGIKLFEKGSKRPTEHPDSIIRIRIPGFPRPSNDPRGARGRFSGSIDTAGNSLGFLFPTPIKGRLRKSEIRQGGRKFVISGRWTWRLNRSRLEKRGRGLFNLTIVRGLEAGVVVWKMSGPFRVGHQGSNPEHNYIYKGRFSAINR